MLVFPVNPDSLGIREVIRGHSFRIREGFDLMFKRFGLCWLE